MSLETAETEKEFIEGVRGIFRAYVPESDAWARPNFFDINAIVIGGLAWSSYNEARNGIDSRLNLRTATGQALDLLASTPPLNFQRLPERPSMGTVRVTVSGESNIPAGTIFSTEGGVEYASIASVGVANGTADIPVASTANGLDQNSMINQPLNFDLSGDAFSLGIVGGDGVECDDDFRRRIFGSPDTTKFLGGEDSYRNVIMGYPGVTRIFFDNGRIYPLFDDSRTCSIPTIEDLQNIAQIFEDECLVPANCPPCLSMPIAKTFAPEIRWCKEPDFCEVEETIKAWLIENYGLGATVTFEEFNAFLCASFSDYAPEVPKCDYCAGRGGVLTCVEIIHGC